MYITSSGPEGSPSINFKTTSGAWYNLKSEVKGTHVKIYVNNKLVKEITMKGSGADSKSNNYVGLWCHNKIPIKGDSFQVQGKAMFLWKFLLKYKLASLHWYFVEKLGLI